MKGLWVPKILQRLWLFNLEPKKPSHKTTKKRSNNFPTTQLCLVIRMPERDFFSDLRKKKKKENRISQQRSAPFVSLSSSLLALSTEVNPTRELFVEVVVVVVVTWKSEQIVNSPITLLPSSSSSRPRESAIAVQLFRKFHLRRKVSQYSYLSTLKLLRWLLCYGVVFLLL